MISANKLHFEQGAVEFHWHYNVLQQKVVDLCTGFQGKQINSLKFYNLHQHLQVFWHLLTSVKVWKIDSCQSSNALTLHRHSSV